MKTNGVKHTRGMVVVDISDGGVFSAEGNTLADTHTSEHLTQEEMDANAIFIAEAFDVDNETGLTPRQLADQNAKLLEALQAATAFVELYTPNGRAIDAPCPEWVFKDGEILPEVIGKHARAVLVEVESTKPTPEAEESPSP